MVRPDLPLGDEELDASAIGETIRSALRRADLEDGHQPVALYFRWQGSATYRRLDDFCRGVIDGLGAELTRGAPLVLVSDSDIGGLVGLHCHEVCGLANPIVSIDGIVVNDFDYIDIGSILDSSGAVPVVIKSLVFPAGEDGGH